MYFLEGFNQRINSPQLTETCLRRLHSQSAKADFADLRRIHSLSRCKLKFSLRLIFSPLHSRANANSAYDRPFRPSSTRFGAR